MLTPGSKLGPYDVIGSLGAGGMGEVYRARDRRLQRDVAIKVLPASVATDPDRLARFSREAQVLASLNHPHIAHVYGIEEAPAEAGALLRGLVMELVDGLTLAERLVRGPLPVDEALNIARQIAEALDAAHERGIVHRDLKPANIKLTADGTVKVLDFGLAKAFDPASGAGRAGGDDLLNSPTITTPAMTEAGLILGTAAYMSPEQARGKPLDKRADIWAFGVVLYEMLTGRRLFEGESVSDTIAEVLKREFDPAELPPGTPPAVLHVLERCLQRDPKLRLRDIGDAGADLRLETTAAGRSAASARLKSASWSSAWSPLTIAAAIVVVAALGVAAWFSGRSASPPARVHRFTIAGAGFNTISNTAISPDGRLVAYSPDAFAAPFRLLVRRLDSFEAREMTSSTATGLNPFFSPDGQWIAFFSETHLMKVPVAGGSPEQIAPLGIWQVRMGSWGRDGTIVIAGITASNNLGGQRRALSRVSSNGGTVAALTGSNEDAAHVDPEILPDGKTVLFTAVTPQSSSIAAVPIEGGEYRVIATDARTPRYSATGHLLFQRASTGQVMAVPFDPATVRLKGDVVGLVTAAQVVDSAAFSVSQDGTLIFSAPEDTSEQSTLSLVSVDRSGKESPILEQLSSWAQPRISPDGRSVLFRHIASPNCDLWTLDLERGTRARVTLEGDNHDPIWHPNGTEITWSSQAGFARGVYSAPVDRANQSRVLTRDEYTRVPESWSRDGARLAFTETNPASGSDIWVWSAANGTAKAVVATRFKEEQAAFSPNGQWLAYVSNQSGRDEVYIQQSNGDGGQMQVSANGGSGPLWSHDGRELFYAEGSKLMIVDVQREGLPRPSRPRMLIQGPYVWERFRNYDVHPSGQSFVFVKRSQGDPVATLRVVLNWAEQLRGQ